MLFHSSSFHQILSCLVLSVISWKILAVFSIILVDFLPALLPLLRSARLPPPNTFFNSSHYFPPQRLVRSRRTWLDPSTYHILRQYPPCLFGIIHGFVSNPTSRPLLVTFHPSLLRLECGAKCVCCSGSKGSFLRGLHETQKGSM